MKNVSISKQFEFFIRKNVDIHSNHSSVDEQCNSGSSIGSDQGTTSSSNKVQKNIQETNAPTDGQSEASKS